MITVKCKKCNKEFKTHSAKIKIGRGKFCSKECYHPKIDYGTKNCIICNKSFSKGKNISKKAWELTKCCSFLCASKYKKTQIPWMKDKHHTDITKQKIREKNKGKHYSIKSEFKKGDNIGNQTAKGNKPNKTSFKKGQIGWNKNTIGLTKANKTSFKKGMIPHNKGNKMEGGKTKEGNKIRHSTEMRFWRRSCLIRDNFTDQKTGISGGELSVHHINNFADFPELHFAIDNGITLSKQSHFDFHHIYGKRNNTREQLLEFLNTK